jgi:DNA polymerase-3 subunit chi
MTRVDFYLIDSPEPGARDFAICKLAHKVHALGHRVYILTADNAESRRLDDLLWTFAAGSFVPHALHDGGTPDPLTPVLIGADAPPESHDDVLITTTPEVAECFSRFKRVAEVVGGADDDKARARDRFRHYRDRGYTLHTHNLS